MASHLEYQNDWFMTQHKSNIILDFDFFEFIIETLGAMSSIAPRVGGLKCTWNIYTQTELSWTL